MAARTLSGLRRERQANCSVKARVGTLRLDGCKDADGWLAREAMSSSSSGTAVSLGVCCPCRRVRQNCPCHGCSPAKKSNSNFMLQSALKRFRRHLLAIPGGRILQCSSDGKVWSTIRRADKGSIVNALVAQVWDFIPTISWTVCDQMTPRDVAALVEATHTSRAALRPGTAAALWFP